MQLYAVVLEVGEERVELILPEQCADAGVPAAQYVVVVNRDREPFVDAEIARGFHRPYRPWLTFTGDGR